MHALGVVYERAPPRWRDPAKALAWYRKGAESNFARSQTNLGFLLQEGRAVAQDLQAAREWYEKAAAQGEPRAKFLLGMLYLDGLGVERDEGRAVALFRRRRDKGEPGGQYRLALMLGTGRGVARDEAAAIELVRKAAAQGHPDAQYYLAEAFANGAAGVPKDERRGLALAAEGRGTGACRSPVHAGDGLRRRPRRAAQPERGTRVRPRLAQGSPCCPPPRCRGRPRAPPVSP